eukprot:765496-Hanusia_phi.AAC.8
MLEVSYRQGAAGLWPTPPAFARHLPRDEKGQRTVEGGGEKGGGRGEAEKSMYRITIKLGSLLLLSLLLLVSQLLLRPASLARHRNHVHVLRTSLDLQREFRSDRVKEIEGGGRGQTAGGCVEATGGSGSGYHRWLLVRD